MMTTSFRMQAHSFDHKQIRVVLCSKVVGIVSINGVSAVEIDRGEGP